MYIIIIPSDHNPDILLQEIPSDSQHYIGHNLTLTCSILAENDIVDRKINVVITWSKNGNEYTSNNWDPDRISITHVTSTSGELYTTYITTLTFSELIRSDSGKYQCKTIISNTVGSRLTSSSASIYFKVKGETKPNFSLSDNNKVINRS